MGNSNTWTWLKWCLSLAVAVLMLATTAHAQSSSKTFRFESEHPNKVEVVIFSSDRKGFQWPGPGRVFILDTDEVTRFKISCLGGEKVCYGAWVAGNSSTYWGLGRSGNRGCSKCCYTCDGGETKIITLED